MLRQRRFLSEVGGVLALEEKQWFWLGSRQALARFLAKHSELCLLFCAYRGALCCRQVVRLLAAKIGLR